MRALLVEDNLQLEASLGIALGDMDFTVDCVRSLSDAGEALKFDKFDAVIIDLDISGGDILTTLRRFQEHCTEIWTLVIGSDATMDLVSAAKENGAEDFIIKPIRPKEFRLRLSTRSDISQTTELRVLECGPIKLDQLTRIVTLDNQELDLTPRERTVLEVLLRNCDITVSKTFIASRIYSFDDEAGPAAIQIYVHRLRRKTKHSAVAIHTVRGEGYRISSTPLPVS